MNLPPRAARLLLLVNLVALPLRLFSAEHRVGSPAEIPLLRLAAGDSIVLADGEWRDQTLTLRGTGTEDRPITVRAKHPGRSVLTGNSHLVLDGAWLVVDGLVLRDGGASGDAISVKGSHNRVTGCAVERGTWKFFLHLYGTQHRVDRCYFAEKTSESPTLQIEVAKDQPNRHRVDHNHFGHRSRLGRNGGETIRIGYSHQSMNNSRTLVEDNLFERCDGELEIISNKSCENTYRANTFLECAGMLTLRHGNRCIVEGNFFLGHHQKGSGGIRIIGEEHVVRNNYIEGVAQGAFWITAGVPNSQLAQYFQAKRCTIAFNTVVDSAGPCFDQSNGLGTSGRTLKPETITLANNLLLVGRGGTLLKGEEGEDWRWRDNVVAGAKTTHAGFDFAEVSLARDAQGLLRPTNTPLHAGYGADAGSPPQGRPLSAADVGPVWRHN